MSKHIKRETPPKEKLILNGEVCCANCKEVVVTQTKRFMCDTCYKMWMRTGVLRKSRAICRICGGKVTGGQHVRHGICKDCVVVRKKHSARFTKEYAVIWESELSGRLSRMDQSEKNYETVLRISKEIRNAVWATVPGHLKKARKQGRRITTPKIPLVELKRLEREKFKKRYRAAGEDARHLVEFIAQYESAGRAAREYLEEDFGYAFKLDPATNTFRRDKSKENNDG